MRSAWSARNTAARFAIRLTLSRRKSSSSAACSRRNTAANSCSSRITRARSAYAADDPEDPRYTLSFDLLFRGLEVTTGGQRIHDYDTQVAKLIKKGMNPEDFAGYLMIHKYGTCPHGGLGLGLERLTARLLGENNVRETCLFPRDQQRIEP